ncbi:MAG TPA: TraR/DksA C4-type zinc finger protein, partial [Chthonomonadales bacterium]|nr:TraR/DksA C4-type zinc finger protein [Chthonomonadales bacterium]
ADSADTAAILSDDERESALDANDLSILKQVDRALDRLDAGQYGICEITGKPIPLARLRALPWATTTVEAAERAEL